MRIKNTCLRTILLLSISFFSFIFSKSTFVIDNQKVFDYPIPHVITRYCRDYGVSEEVAKIHELELKKWFILAAKYSDGPLDMFSSEIDNLWHTFLLFTQDYQKFCHEMFGRFIHHVPKIEHIQN